MAELVEKNEVKSCVPTQNLPLKDLEGLIKRYEKELRYIAFKYVRDWTIVDDIMQEVYIKIFLRLNSFENRASIRSWLYTITCNQSIDYLRSKTVQSTYLIENIEEMNIANTDSAEVVAIKQYEKDSLCHLVDTLPTEYMEPIKLFYYKHYSYKEISELLNENIGTIKNRLFRGRRLLKEKYLLNKYGLIEKM